MKPRLLKLCGLWYCVTDWKIQGLGWTPLQAYDDWRNLNYNAEARRLKKEAE